MTTSSRVVLWGTRQEYGAVGLQFAIECKAVGMRVITSKSEAMVVLKKAVVCPLQVEDKEYKASRLLVLVHESG